MTTSTTNEIINPFGLYKLKGQYSRNSLPNFKSDPILDDQTQGWWLPFYDENGDIYLVDTYHISGSPLSSVEIPEDIEDTHPELNIEARSDYSNTNNFINRLLYTNLMKSSCDYLIRRANFDYYYSGSIKIDKDNIDYFEEVCDLREFELADDDYDNYNEEDYVSYVQLWFEHYYNSWGRSGVTIMRIDAKPNKEYIDLNIARDILSNIKSDYTGIYSDEYFKELVNKLKSIINTGTEKSVNNARYALAKLEKAYELQKEFKEFVDNLDITYEY